MLKSNQDRNQCCFRNNTFFLWLNYNQKMRSLILLFFCHVKYFVSLFVNTHGKSVVIRWKLLFRRSSRSSVYMHNLFLTLRDKNNKKQKNKNKAKSQRSYAANCFCFCFCFCQSSENKKDNFDPYLSMTYVTGWNNLYKWMYSTKNSLSSSFCQKSLTLPIKLSIDYNPIWMSLITSIT
jgi:hypothetical protein